MCRYSQEGLSGSRARQMLLFCTSIMFSAATVTMFIDVATSVLEILFYDPSAVYPDALLIRWDMVTNVMVRLVVSFSISLAQYGPSTLTNALDLVRDVGCDRCLESMGSLEAESMGTDVARDMLCRGLW